MKKLLSLGFLISLCAVCGSCTFSATTAQKSVVKTETTFPNFDSRQTIWTSTREINALKFDKSGALWAAANGGVLRRAPNGKWTKWTRQNGLPSHEARAIQIVNDRVSVQTPRGAATFSGVWKSAPDFSTNNDEITWNSARVRATLLGLEIVGKSSTRSVPVPGQGTHISALWGRGERLLAASFGDNVYRWNGTDWRSLKLVLPTEARDITVMCEDAERKTLWLGTRRAGVWRVDLKTRKATPSSQHEDEPLDHNVQFLASFKEKLWVSTLEAGLTCFDGKLWQHYSTPQISSVAPRQMTVFRGALYVRHGDGQVDKYDGKCWAKDVWSQLPRRKVFALASDDARLVAVQYGGWSEWNGATWTHHFDVAALQSASLVSVLLDGETLWLGTQNRGLIEYSMTQKTARVYDERDGLPDDWITCLRKVGDTLYAGTFVGGVARFDGTKWTTPVELKGENVTAIEAETNASNDTRKRCNALVATRHGLWKIDGESARQLDEKTVDPEAQSLLQTPQGLLIGTRTGIFFKPN